MRNNYVYFFSLIVICLSTLLSTTGSALGRLPEMLADTVKTKEVVTKLVYTRDIKTKDKSLLAFKPFAPYAPILKPMSREQVKTLSNVKIYPNPVSEQLNLSFRLSKETGVSIKIMDALGNEINTLLSERLKEGDQVHNFMLNNKLSSGFYFIRIMAGTETVVKRIQIL